MKNLFILILLMNCLEAKKNIFDFSNNSPTTSILQGIILTQRPVSISTILALPSNPVPTSSGNLSAITVKWLAASGTNITYKLYRKKTFNFDSITQVESGNLIATTTNLEHIVTDELSGNGNYYNVIASDGITKQVYQKFRLEQGDIAKIFLFAINGTTNGNMGGLSGANNLCEATRTATFANDFTCTGVRALISVSGNELINAPATDRFQANRELFGVHTSSKVQTKVCNNWSSCFPNLLGPNGMDIVLGVGSYFYTFSNADATYNLLNNCTNGTLNSGNGAYAYNNQMNNWLGGLLINCSTIYKILCICY